jgi:hypothetical protein
MSLTVGWHPMPWSLQCRRRPRPGRASDSSDGMSCAGTHPSTTPTATQLITSPDRYHVNSPPSTVTAATLLVHTLIPHSALYPSVSVGGPPARGVPRAAVSQRLRRPRPGRTSGGREGMSSASTLNTTQHRPHRNTKHHHVDHWWHRHSCNTSTAAPLQ